MRFLQFGTHIEIIVIPQQFRARAEPWFGLGRTDDIAEISCPFFARPIWIVQNAIDLYSIRGVVADVAARDYGAHLVSPFGPFARLRIEANNRQQSDNQASDKDAHNLKARG